MVFDVARTLDIARVGGATLEFVEQLAIGLAITLTSTLRRPRWAMPSTISWTPSWPPRLMICSRAGMVASPPSRPKRLVPTKRLPEKRSKPSASISLLRIAFLPSGVNLTSLSAPSMRRWQPVLLLGIVDMHEFIADAPAIGALQRIEDLARCGGVRAQHAGDEHRLVQRRALEAVKGGVELGMLDARGDAQGIEVGFEMAHHPPGADHLHGADAFQRIGGGRGVVAAVAEGFLAAAGAAGLAGQGGGQLVLGKIGSAIALPSRPLAQLGRAQPLFAQVGEIARPGRIDAAGIGQVLGIKLFDEGCVGARQKAVAVRISLDARFDAIGRRLF